MIHWIILQIGYDQSERLSCINQNLAGLSSLYVGLYSCPTRDDIDMPKSVLCTRSIVWRCFG